MLTFSQGDRGAGAVTFHGLTTRPVIQRHTGPWEAVGLVLPPATAVRLMGPTTGAVTDAAVPWEAMAGSSEAERLLEVLQGARSASQCLDDLQGSVQRMLARDSARGRRQPVEVVQRTCALIGEHGARAAAAMGIGPRQLERRCVALLGLPPKQLQRLTRFRAALAQALRQQRRPDVQAALAAGYYDQSHLAPESLTLAGGPLRVPLPAAHADGDWWPLATQRLMPA